MRAFVRTSGHPPFGIRVVQLLEPFPSRHQLIRWAFEPTVGSQIGLLESFNFGCMSKRQGDVSQSLEQAAFGKCIDLKAIFCCVGADDNLRHEIDAYHCAWLFTQLFAQSSRRILCELDRKKAIFETIAVKGITYACRNDNANAVVIMYINGAGSR